MDAVAAGWVLSETTENRTVLRRFMWQTPIATHHQEVTIWHTGRRFTGSTLTQCTTPPKSQKLAKLAEHLGVPQ